MSTQVEGSCLGDILLREEPACRSRELCAVASGYTIARGQVCRSDSAGRKLPVVASGNEVHTYTLTGVPTSGTFRLQLYTAAGAWVWTDDIAYNASNAALDAAIEGVLGTGAVTATATGAGSAITAVAIVFAGAGYSGQTWPLGRMDHANLAGVSAWDVTRSTSAGVAVNEVQAFKVESTGAIASGTFRIRLTDYLGKVQTTGDIAFSSAPTTLRANIQAALDAVTASNAIVAQFLDGDNRTIEGGVALTYSGTGYTGSASPLAEIVDNQLDDAGRNGSRATMWRVTAGGPAGSAAGNVADSIALADIDASSAEAEGLFVVRAAIVDADTLVYGGGDPAACAAALAAQGIAVRPEPTVSTLG